MRNVIQLRKNGVYFLVGFYDKRLSIPSVSTYIYDGYDDQFGHLFIDAKEHGNNPENKEDCDAAYICFEKDNINGILDKKHLIEWLSEDHTPENSKEDYIYEVAPVI